MKLAHIRYSDLNSRQKERYNFQKIAGLLADYGFSSIKLDDDWQSADFLAQHIDGSTFIKVQLKGRLTFDKKYIGKSIYISFPYFTAWYLFNHDEVLNLFTTTFSKAMALSSSWINNGTYSWNQLSKQILRLLEPYKLASAPEILLSETELNIGDQSNKKL